VCVDSATVSCRVRYSVISLESSDGWRASVQEMDGLIVLFHAARFQK
jgi:hypothetical protein